MEEDKTLLQKTWEEHGGKVTSTKGNESRGRERVHIH